jgi:AcrR family transcriptional regulator
MLEAMADTVADKGFARATVADVIRRAGVSRETFYEQFTDKDDCFLAAFDGAADLLAGAIGRSIESVGSAADVFERLDAAFAVYLDVLADEPAIARTFLVDVYGAGPQALARRVEVMKRFVDLVAGIVGARDAEERFACEALVASISSLVTMRVAVGDHASLPGLREPLMAIARRVLDA